MIKKRKKKKKKEKKKERNYKKMFSIISCYGLASKDSHYRSGF